MCNFVVVHLCLVLVLLMTVLPNDGTNGILGHGFETCCPPVWKTGMDGMNADTRWWETKRRSRRMVVVVEGVVEGVVV